MEVEVKQNSSASAELSQPEHVQNSIRAALGNSLVMGIICSYTNSEKDLRNFRLVNRLFYREATKRHRLLQKPINLESEYRIKPFLLCVKTRLDPIINPFPFVAFRLNLSLSVEGLRDFLTHTGEHMRHLEVLSTRSADGPSLAGVKQRLVIILSAARNLKNFECNTDFSVHLNPEDITALPSSFPTLRNIHINYDRVDNSRSPTSVPLLSHLIPLTSVLDHVHVPSIKENHKDEILAVRLILQHHEGQLPVISLNNSRILPKTLRDLRELTQIGLTFRNFPVELNPPVDHLAEQLELIVRTQNILNAITWLGTQPSTVTSLRVDLKHLGSLRSFQLPPLTTLKELTIHCPRYRLSPALQPLTPPNPFPALRKLTLINYDEKYGFFDHCSFLSVQELHMLCNTSELTRPWHTILPNLTTIVFQASAKIEAVYEEDVQIDRHNLGFLLRHFPRITGLKLKLDMNSFWDVLTGGAPRPPSNWLIYYGDLGRSVGEPETPIDGVYQIASLRNLRDLKWLQCHPESRINLDAILYMTRAGLLGPLQEISLRDIHARKFQIQYESGEYYRTAFAQFHDKVKFDFKLEGQTKFEWWARYKISPILLQDFISFVPEITALSQLDLPAFFRASR